MTTPPSILAIVLTHNAPAALERCLNAIDAQTHPPDRVLVVDNASAPNAALGSHLAPSTLLRREINDGPGGGHRAGLEHFLTTDMDVAWVMDDDIIPHPTCLEELLRRRETMALDKAVFPLSVDGPTGQEDFFPAWCGFIVSRTLVARIGLPRAEFIWWVEDTEYLQWRMINAGAYPANAPLAIVTHDRVRSGPSKPPWKFYYEVRNTIVYRLYVQPISPKGVWFLLQSLIRLLGHVVLREDHKLSKLVAYGRGVVDGLTNRLGLRQPLGGSAPVRSLN